MSFFIDMSEVTDAMIATGLYVSLCTIRTETKAQDAYGAYVSQVPPVYTNLHVDVPCQFGTPQGVEARRLVGMEQRTANLTHVSLERELIIPQYFDDFNDKIQNVTAYQVVVDGIEYNVMALVNDSQRSMTELHVQLVTSGTWGSPS